VGVLTDHLDGPGTGRRALLQLVAGAVWLAGCAAAAGIGACWFVAAASAYMLVGLDPHPYRLFIIALAIVLTVAWLALAIALERWLSGAATLARLARRSLSLLAAEGAVLAASYGAVTLLGAGMP
jgi:hypothetical protein